MSRCRSSADVVLSYSPGSLPESPKPRRSTAKTRWLAASSGMSLLKAHQVSGNPWTSRTGDPRPRRDVVQPGPVDLCVVVRDPRQRGTSGRGVHVFSVL